MESRQALCRLETNSRAFEGWRRRWLSTQTQDSCVPRAGARRCAADLAWAGAFIAARRRSRSKTEEMRDAQQLVREFVDNLKEQGLDEGEIRRLFEAELAGELQRR